MRFSKRLFLFLLIMLSLLPLDSSAHAKDLYKPDALLVRVFYLPHCKSCIKAIHDIIPPIAEKYGQRVRWQYMDMSNVFIYQQFLDLERITGKELDTPTILIADKILVGLTDIADNLEKEIEVELPSVSKPLALNPARVNILARFQTFRPLTVISAGLVDGINPCAFTVIVFFVSFLTFVGYRRREMALIGVAYVAAVFATYLVLGLGFFKALYSLKVFLMISKMIYLVVGGLSLFLGCLALNDYFRYKKTGNTDEMALQLPRPIKNKIHAIIGNYYRKDKNEQKKSLFGLFLSALAVGFMISLLEAVCTGQLYLPTIIFVLKEGSLRAKALFYLIVYNIMFIAPLVIVFFLALAGVSSKQFEAFARQHLGLIKLAMAAVFFGLGVALWVGYK